MHFPLSRQPLAALALLLGLCVCSFSGVAATCNSSTVMDSRTTCAAVVDGNVQQQMSLRVLNYTFATITDLVVYRGGDFHPNNTSSLAAMPASAACFDTEWGGGQSGFCWRIDEWLGYHWIASLNPFAYTGGVAGVVSGNAVIAPINMNTPVQSCLANNPSCGTDPISPQSAIDPAPPLALYVPINNGTREVIPSASLPVTNFAIQPPQFNYIDAGKQYYDGGSVATSGRSPYLSISMTMSLGALRGSRCKVNINLGGSGTFSNGPYTFQVLQCEMSPNMVSVVMSSFVVSNNTLNVTLVLGCSAGSQYPCPLVPLSKGVTWRINDSTQRNGCAVRQNMNDVVNGPARPGLSRDYYC
jgi:hypothetical protein